jgi:hypothetical protein
MIWYSKFYNKRPVATSLDWFFLCCGLIRTGTKRSGYDPLISGSVYTGCGCQLPRFEAKNQTGLDFKRLIVVSSCQNQLYTGHWSDGGWVQKFLEMTNRLFLHARTRSEVMGRSTPRNIWLPYLKFRFSCIHPTLYVKLPFPNILSVQVTLNWEASLAHPCLTNLLVWA